MRVAVLDLGSNSLHLLVVDADADGRIAPLLREREMPRLGSVVARTGEVPPEHTRAAIGLVERFRHPRPAVGA